MEKLEAFVLIVVVLTGLVGLYFIYSPYGLGIQFIQKDFCRSDTDITFWPGESGRYNSCEYRVVVTPPGERSTAYIGNLEATGFTQDGKVVFRESSAKGENEFALAEGEAWKGPVIGLIVTQTNPSKGMASIKFYKTIPDVSVETYWDYETKRREHKLKSEFDTKTESTESLYRRSPNPFA